MNKTHQTLKITIAGAGSIGFFIGGLLQVSGHNLSFLARESMIKKINSTGLHLTDYTGLDTHIASSNLDLQSSPDCLSTADIILVTVKSAATREMANLIKQHANPSAIIISLQNGLTNSALLKETLPTHKVLSGMVPFNVAQMDKARFHRGTSGEIIIEETEDNLAQHLTSDQLVFKQSNNMPAIQSGKLLINLNNALNALSGLPLLEQLNNKGWRKIMADQISEAHTIMKLAGMSPEPPSPVPTSLIPHILRLPTPLFKMIAKRMLSIDPLARSSMWEDLQTGRKTEIDELQGEIVKIASKLNLDAPINYQVMAKIKEAEDKGLGSPQIKPEDI